MTITPAWTQQDRLRKAREHAGLTQKELAQRLRIGRTTVANYENGTTLPKFPVLLAWADATAVPLSFIDPSDLPISDSPWSGAGRRASDVMVAA